MAVFPDNIAGFRDLENVPGNDYDELKLNRLYAEDINSMAEEIVAIETALGSDLLAGYLTFQLRVLYLENALASFNFNFLENSYITSDDTIDDPDYCHDGVVDSDFYSGLPEGLHWLMFQLVQPIGISKIKWWHFFTDERTYHDVIVQTSLDGTNWLTHWNTDDDNSAGQGVGTDAEDKETAGGWEITFPRLPVQYIRFWSNGSDVNDFNHYVECQAFF